MGNLINWYDKCKTKIYIYHHLRSCVRKYEKYVDIESDVAIEGAYNNNYMLSKDSGRRRAEIELNKELIDLYILIESLICQSNLYQNVNERIEILNNK